MKRFLDGVKELGYEKPRSAVALLPLSLFSFVYLLGALNSPPEWKLALIGLSACYLTAFLALASEWFWARWYASGLGWSGSMVGLVALIMMGWSPELAIYGGLHAVIVVMLLGTKMAARYDLQPGWRQRYGMDEFGVARLKKAVTRAAAALPSLIIWALGPGEGQGAGLVVGAATVLTLLGLHGLVKLRTWGVLALGGAGLAVLLGTPPASAPFSILLDRPDPLGVAVASPGTAGALAVLLIGAALPFASAAVRYFRSLR
jgi:hypothetical protein